MLAVGPIKSCHETSNARARAIDSRSKHVTFFFSFAWELQGGVRPGIPVRLIRRCYCDCIEWAGIDPPEVLSFHCMATEAEDSEITQAGCKRLEQQPVYMDALLGRTLTRLSIQMGGKRGALRPVIMIQNPGLLLFFYGLILDQIISTKKKNYMLAGDPNQL